MNSTTQKQQTVNAPTSIEGVGYWSGLDVRVEFHPAAADSGVVFVREDLEGRPRIPALVDCRINTPRRSDLEHAGVRVEMVEHVLAALRGLEIDNCEVRVTNSEMPGLDGSAAPFVEALGKVGRVALPAARRPRVLASTIRVGDDETWIEARPSADGSTRFDYTLDYGADNPIGRQHAAIRLTPETFEDEVAPARTFLLHAEAQWLRERGLGVRISPRDLLVFDRQGPIDNTLRFRNECARHKLLDMTGDFALAGCDLIAHVSAYRSGHHLNAELVRAILAATAHQVGFRRCA